MHSTLPTSNVSMRSARVSAAPHAQPRIRTPAATLRAIKLYTNPGTRGKMADWALAELGLQYEEVLVDMKKGQHKTPEYLAIHPFGMVPALVDDKQSIFESGAILLHLANKYGRYTPDQLGTAAQWVLFANSTFSEAFFFKGPSQSSGRLLQVVDGILAKNTYITGETFSIADIALAGYLLYLPLFFPDLEVPKNIWRYMELCASRPGCPAPYKQGVEQAKARNDGPANVFSRIMGRK